MQTRRAFLQTSAAATLALSAPAVARRQNLPDTKLKILFLGGTGFLGPHTVRDAVTRGHTVTLFNRGKTAPDLFPDLETITGDRYGDISGLEGRQWDVAIDTFTYIPGVVRRAAGLLAPNIKRYIVISTMSVYGTYPTVGMDESSPLATMSDEDAARFERHSDQGYLQFYGPMKARCEKAAEEVMPGRACHIRPGLIVGPGDPSDRWTYWPWRVRRGGEVLAPNSPDDPIQFIDVRDLARFVVLAVEKSLTGAFNAICSPGMTIGTLLQTCKDVTGSDAAFTWADAEFLSAHGVNAWAQMPAWIPPEGDYLGFGRIDTSKAHAAGLHDSPAEITVRDTLAWIEQEGEELRQRLDGAKRVGLTAEREAEILKAWHER